MREYPEMWIVLASALFILCLAYVDYMINVSG